MDPFILPPAIFKKLLHIVRPRAASFLIELEGKADETGGVVCVGSRLQEESWIT
jgi:hypothetical protein